MNVGTCEATSVAHEINERCESPISVGALLAALREPFDTDTRFPAIPDSAVRPRLTPNRRAKRPRRDVETMDFIGAAKRFMRAAGRRVGECDEIELAALIELRTDLEAAIAAAVDGQRARGKSWAEIARGTGTARESAYQRYGRRS